MSVAAGDTPTPLTFLSDWSIVFTMARADVTPLGSTSAIYIASIRSISGDFTGFCDNATSQTYRAAADGQPRDFILYPNINSGQNWAGQIYPDFAVSGAVADAVKLKVTWDAATDFTFSGAVSGEFYTATYAATYGGSPLAGVLDEGGSAILDESGATIVAEG